MRTKKVKPPQKKHEFSLEISKRRDEIEKKNFIRFMINTTKQFLTFRYLIDVDTKVENNKIVFIINGFTAPVYELSNPGYAGFEYRLFNYKLTDYKIELSRFGKQKSNFLLSVTRSKSQPLKLKRVKSNSFIDIKLKENNDT